MDGMTMLTLFVLSVFVGFGFAVAFDGAALSLGAADGVGVATGATSGTSVSTDW